MINIQSDIEGIPDLSERTTLTEIESNSFFCGTELRLSFVKFRGIAWQGSGSGRAALSGIMLVMTAGSLGPSCTTK